MKLNEAIAELEKLRDEIGGEAQVCLLKETVADGRVTLFEPASFDHFRVIKVNDGRNPHWLALLNGNDTDIVGVM